LTLRDRSDSRRLEGTGARYAEQHRKRARGSDFVYGGLERAEAICRAIGAPGKRILDIGCRSGALTRSFAEGNEVVGLDVDRDALAEAAKLGIQTVWADAEEALPFEDASFDVVVAAELLEHLREPERLVREAGRILRPGGALVGSVPNAYRLKNRLRFLAGRDPERNPTHLHLFHPRDVLALLTAFEDPQLEFVVGRFVALHPRLLANTIVFSARTPS
jgi:SAM-dependent methyltransferase